MRKWILDLHLYLGLLCAPYLVVYGVSAIAFNHDIKGGSSTSQWSAVVVAEGGTDLERAEEVRDALGLVGWTPERSVIRTDDALLRFRVQNPGRDYLIEWDDATGSTEVDETRSSWIAILRGIHGMRDLEGSVLGPVWYVYTEVSSWALAFAALSGIYLWLPRRSAALGTATVVAGAVVLAVLSIGVW